MMNNSLTGWENYPMNLAGYGSTTMDGLQLNQQLKKMEKTLFSDKLRIRVTDIQETRSGERDSISSCLC